MRTLAERFWPKVDKSGDCWLWTASRSESGYGRIRVGASDGQMRLAHRVAYEMVIGPVPPGLQIDHLCRVRACVNPSHMEPVTQQENLRRGDTGKHLADRTHCPSGHPYSPENTYQFRNNRQCRACRAARSRARREALS